MNTGTVRQQTMELVTAWHNWQPGSQPYLLNGDESILSKRGLSRRIATYSSWEAYIGEVGFGVPGDTRLHLGLVPVPFAGDLERARVFVLLLNPGLEPDDYFAEYKVSGFRERLICNLRQDFSRSECHFIYLDPAIAWHSGYRWWHGKFQGVIADLAKNWDVRFADAGQHFSRILACVELVPYHSVSYNLSDGIREQLRSVRIAREYVHDCLWPRAKAGEVLIVVTRHCAKWGLSESSHVVTYLGSETRAAHLSPKSRGGKRIVEFARELGPQ